MAICVRCNKNASFWMGGVNRQTGLCRTCEHEVRLQTIANIRNGFLPTIHASIHLETDEICHMELPATYHKTTSKSVNMVPGRFIATSKKLHFIKM